MGEYFTIAIKCLENITVNFSGCHKRFLHCKEETYYTRLCFFCRCSQPLSFILQE